MRGSLFGGSATPLRVRSRSTSRSLSSQSSVGPQSNFAILPPSSDLFHDDYDVCDDVVASSVIYSVNHFSVAGNQQKEERCPSCGRSTKAPFTARLHHVCDSKLAPFGPLPFPAPPSTILSTMRTGGGGSSSDEVRNTSEAEESDNLVMSLSGSYYGYDVYDDVECDALVFGGDPFWNEGSGGTSNCVERRWNKTSSHESEVSSSGSGSNGSNGRRRGHKSESASSSSSSSSSKQNSHRTQALVLSPMRSDTIALERLAREDMMRR